MNQQSKPSEPKKAKIKGRIKEFFVVTMNSVYHVGPVGDDQVQATKIAINPGHKSKVAVGGSLGGPWGIISIGERLIPFTRAGGGVAPFQREIAQVKAVCAGPQSTSVVALFETKESAIDCGRQSDLKPCDDRWKQFTIGVLRAIGPDHPDYSISKSASMRLLPPEEWKT